MTFITNFKTLVKDFIDFLYLISNAFVPYRVLEKHGGSSFFVPVIGVAKKNLQRTDLR